MFSSLTFVSRFRRPCPVLHSVPLFVSLCFGVPHILCSGCVLRVLCCLVFFDCSCFCPSPVVSVLSPMLALFPSELCLLLVSLVRPVPFPSVVSSLLLVLCSRFSLAFSCFPLLSVFPALSSYWSRCFGSNMFHFLLKRCSAALRSCCTCTAVHPIQHHTVSKTALRPQYRYHALFKES